MSRNVTCIEVRSPEGALIFTCYLYEKVTGEGAADAAGAGENSGAASPNGSLMTEAQQRYLFRLMADQGYEGDKAHRRLKDLFGVPVLKEVTKQEASRMIERLLEEAKTHGSA